MHSHATEGRADRLRSRTHAPRARFLLILTTARVGQLLGGTLANGFSGRVYYCVPDNCGWLSVGGGGCCSGGSVRCGGDRGWGGDGSSGEDGDGDDGRAGAGEGSSSPSQCAASAGVSVEEETGGEAPAAAVACSPDEGSG